MALIGFALFGLGAFLTIANFYFSLLRYPVHVWRGGTRENYRWESGIPVFGSLFLWVSAFCLTTQPIFMWLAIGLSLFDTAGLHWFLGVMLYQCFKEDRPRL
jgi:hypothetical protein